MNKIYNADAVMLAHQIKVENNKLSFSLPRDLKFLYKGILYTWKDDQSYHDWKVVGLALHTIFTDGIVDDYLKPYEEN